MPYKPGRGKTLLIPSGTARDPNKKHLFVTLTDVCSDGQHLLVSISRVKEGVHHDDACMFEPGEHAFVREKSFAAYRLARIDTAAHLIRCVDGWEFTPKEDMPTALVDRMCAGIEQSDFIPQRIINYYRRVIGGGA
jgi:hypothetical protein